MEITEIKSLPSDGNKQRWDLTDCVYIANDL